MQRRTFIKHLGLAASLPLLGRGLPGAQAAAAAEAKAGTLKILTCNIRVDMPADAKSGDGWASRRDFCAAVIRAQSADLIGLQEVQNAHFEYLKAALPDYGSFGLSHPIPAFSPANAIFYSRARFEVISTGGFWLSEKPHVAGSRSWDSANSRLANWVHLKDRSSGKELRMWNTHLDHIGQEAREKGAALIVEASEIFPKGFPQFLTGDLNAGVTNQAIQRLVDAGWTDTFGAVNGPEDPGLTAHGFQGEKASPKRADGTVRQKIDWIFCRGPVKPLKSAILRDSRDGHYPSDHYFVSAEVAL